MRLEDARIIIHNGSHHILAEDMSALIYRPEYLEKCRMWLQVMRQAVRQRASAQQLNGNEQWVTAIATVQRHLPVVQPRWPMRQDRFCHLVAMGWFKAATEAGAEWQGCPIP